MVTATKSLAPAEAKRLIRRALTEGRVTFTKHAREEMAADAIDMADALRVLRAGVVEPAELEQGGYRHRVHASDTWVVVEFVEDESTLVITAWRRKR